MSTQWNYELFLAMLPKNWVHNLNIRAQSMSLLAWPGYSLQLLVFDLKKNDLAGKSKSEVCTFKFCGFMDNVGWSFWWNKIGLRHGENVLRLFGEQFYKRVEEWVRRYKHSLNGIELNFRVERD